MISGTIFAEDYEIISLLGRGGMGEVYKARFVPLDTTVAVKLLHAHGEGGPTPLDIQRVKQEARITSLLNHPGIVRPLRISVTEGGIPYLVFEYVEGQTLDEILKTTGPLSEERFLRVMSQILDALQFAHSQGVIHRDLKPSNIIIGTKDGAEFVKILDFGVSKLLDPDSSKNTNTATQLFGTVAYMSPEQFKGQRSSSLSDLYSLACVMYECLAGNPPFGSASGWDLAAKHLTDSPAPFPVPAKTRSTENIRAAILATLNKEPADRPQSAAALKSALLGDVQLEPKTSLNPDKKDIRRLRAPLVAAVGLIVVVGLGLAIKTVNDNATPDSTKDPINTTSAQSPLFLLSLARLEHQNNKNQESIEHLREALVLVESDRIKTDPRFRYELRNELADVLQAEKLYQEARIHRLASQKESLQLDDRRQIDALLALSQNAEYLGHTIRATQYAAQATDRAEKSLETSNELDRLDRHRTAAFAWGFVGAHALTWQNSKLAEKAARRALHHADQQPLTRLTMEKANDLAGVLIYVGKIDEAIDLLHKRVLLTTAPSDEDEISNRAQAEEWLCEAFRKQGRLAEADQAMVRSLALTERTEEKYIHEKLGIRHYKRATLFLAQNNIASADAEWAEARREFALMPAPYGAKRLNEKTPEYENALAQTKLKLGGHK